MRAAHERADGRAEALREAERHRVERLGPHRRGRSRRDDRVPQARAVEVQGEPVLLRRLRRVLQLIEREHAAARTVVGVLDREDARRREMHLVGRDRGAHVRAVEAAAAPERLHLHAPESGGRTGLVEQDVRVFPGEQHVAGLRQRAQRRLIPHGSGGDEERRGLAEQLGGARLQPIDARVFAVDVVADLGARHRLAHRRRRPGHGIAAQVERAHGWQCSRTRETWVARRTVSLGAPASSSKGRASPRARDARARRRAPPAAPDRRGGAVRRSGGRPAARRARSRRAPWRPGATRG